MNYKPKKYMMGDAWQYSDGETVDLFYLQKTTLDDMDDKLSGSLGHAVSRDLIHWEELEPALSRGNNGSYDDLDIWTGCTVEKDGIFYLFYTSRNSEHKWFNSISVATSTDKVHWEKYEGNPIITPNPKYYCSADDRCRLAVHGNSGGDILDCRDLSVVYDEEKKHWWGYFAVRRHGKECTETSVVGLAKSYDLLHWEQLPPCFTPNKYHCIETPEVFCLNGKWYMLCLTGNGYGQRNPTEDPNLFGLVTIYACADRPEGPFYVSDGHTVLIGSMQPSGVCARTFMYKGSRYLFFTQAQHMSDGSVKTSLSLPHEVVSDKSGQLALKWYKGIESCYRGNAYTPCKENALENHGQWGSVCDWIFEGSTVSANPKGDFAVQMFADTFGAFVMETTIHQNGCRSAGVIFDLNGDTIYCDNNVVLLDFNENEVWITKARDFTKYNARRYSFTDKTYRLRVIAVDNTITVYINDCMLLHHQLERTGGKIGLFAEAGNVIFKNTVVHLIG